MQSGYLLYSSEYIIAVSQRSHRPKGLQSPRLLHRLEHIERTLGNANSARPRGIHREAAKPRRRTALDAVRVAPHQTEHGLCDFFLIRPKACINQAIPRLRLNERTRFGVSASVTYQLAVSSAQSFGKLEIDQKSETRQRNSGGIAGFRNQLLTVSFQTARLIAPHLRRTVSFCLLFLLFVCTITAVCCVLFAACGGLLHDKFTDPAAGLWVVDHAFSAWVWC